MKVITIGRSIERNDVVVNDEKVSRNHLQLIVDDQGDFSVVDLNSTNGTFVNGHRITGETKLKVTDELRIGNTVLPWQSYFGKRSETEINNPASSQPTASSRFPFVSSVPKRWQIYVIVGVLALLLAGGGFGWMIYHNNKQLKEAKKRLEKAQKAYNEALLDYTEKVEKAKKTNSPQDIEAAEKAAANVTKTKNELSAAKTGVVNVSQKVNARESSLQSGGGESQKGGASESQLSQATEKQEQKGKTGNTKEVGGEVSAPKQQENESNNKPHLANKDIGKSEDKTATVDYSQEMQKILGNWSDDEALLFCEYMRLQGACKNNAKKVIKDAYSYKNDLGKENYIKKMREFSNYDMRTKKAKARNAQNEWKNLYK